MVESQILDYLIMREKKETQSTNLNKQIKRGSVDMISIDRWMDKEAVVHIYNGILLSHKKECIWVSANEVDDHRARWEQTYGHDWGQEGGEGGVYRESDVDTYITMCKIDSQWAFAVWLPVWLKEFKLGFSDNVEGWDGAGGSSGRGHGKPMADSCWCLVETNTIILQFKINTFFKKRVVGKMRR